MKNYLHQNEECECEICYLGSASLCADPSRFLLVVGKNIVQPKKPDLIDYFPQKKMLPRGKLQAHLLKMLLKVL